MRWRHLDRITHLEPWAAIAAVKQVSLEQADLATVAGWRDVLPPTLLLAAHAELALWLVLASSDRTVAAVPAAVEAWSPTGIVANGQGLDLRAFLVERDADGAVFDLTTSRDGADLGGGRLRCALRPATDLASAADWRRRWQELGGPLLRPAAT